MAEKAGELNSIDKLDPVSTAAGAGHEESLERYSSEGLDTSEFRADTGDDATQETEQIKARIEETRNQMGETIDAIQERLSFANISDHVSETVSHVIETAKDTAYDATIGKAVNFMKNIGDGVTHSSGFKTIRNNPFPLALIGLGTGLLVYQSMSKKNSARDGNGRDRRFYDRGNGEDRKSTLASASRTVGDSTSRAYDGIADKANSALESVTNVAGSALGSVSDAASNVYSGAGDVAYRAYERAGEYGTLAHDKYDEYLEDNPLALGALAVAVGAAVGFAIPATRYEGELMGEARENLLQRAQDAAGSLVDQAKSVATNVATGAGQTIKNEARALTD